MKSLLVLIRKSKAVLREEEREFVTLGELKQHEVLDVFSEPDFRPDMVLAYDAVFIGGMSDDPSDSVELDKSNYPFIDNLKDLIRLCVSNSIPTFASCGGFQIAGEVLGGEVIIDLPNKELGCYDLHLTSFAKKDPLLFDFPAKFSVIAGHNKRLASLPASCQLLGYTELCPFHIYKVANRPFYAFQFHPEITPVDFYARVEPYWDKYFASREEFESLARKLGSASLSNSLVKKFVERVVLGNN